MPPVNVFVVFFKVDPFLSHFLVKNENAVDLPKLVKALGVNDEIVDKALCGKTLYVKSDQLVVGDIVKCAKLDSDLILSVFGVERVAKLSEEEGLNSQ